VFALLPSHGANPAALLQQLNVSRKEELLDFSVNINPLGPPEAMEALWPSWKESAFDYPAIGAVTLAHELASRLSIHTEELLITNGAAEAFFLLAGWLSGKQAAVLEPTFVEYHRACEAFGCKMISVPLKEDGWQWPLRRLLDVIPLVDALWICHPNNPTGVMYPKEQWEVLLEKANAYNTAVIIDEAFIDFVDEPIDFISYLKQQYPVILVRSMTKMFHIAGIRLGYVMASPPVIASLAERQPPWSVNGVAEQMGLVCLEQAAFVEKTVRLIKKEREWLTGELQSSGISTSPSSANFILCSIPTGWNSREWLTHLAKEGIVVRHTENFPRLDGRFFRVAVKTREENEQLLHVMRKVVTERARIR
jgi:threonine-phosphate decarboxylase